MSNADSIKFRWRQSRWLLDALLALAATAAISRSGDLARCDASTGPRGPVAVAADPATSSGNAGVFIGVCQFDAKALNNLKYTVDDAVSLAHLFVVEIGLVPPQRCFLRISGEPSDPVNVERLKTLEKLGVDRGSATKNAILDALETAGRVTQDKDGLLLTTFSTHGESVGEKNLVCIYPSDARLGRADADGVNATLLSLAEIKEAMKDSKAGKRLFLVDACRVITGPKAAMALPNDRVLWKELSGVTGTAMLFSCEKGQRSWDIDEVKAGAFSMAVREVLSGTGKGLILPDRQGIIRLDALSAAVRARTQDLVYRSKRVDQTPEVGETSDVQVLKMPLARVLTAEVLEDPDAAPADRGRVLAATLDGHPGLLPDACERNRIRFIAMSAGGVSDSVTAFVLKYAEDFVSDVPVRAFYGRNRLQSLLVSEEVATSDIQLRAEAGEAWAMSALGSRMMDGLCGADKNQSAALRWLRKGADAGSGDAMLDLGVAYENGRAALTKDLVEAVHWYHEAANAGNGSGMCNLGVAYEDGQGGLSKDDAEAVRWYRKSADAYNGQGMFNLGLAYAKGQGGLSKDDAEAVRWYRKSADAGNGKGMCNLGLAYETGKGGLSKDDAEAVRWYRKSADTGDGQGMCNLGFAYENGQGRLSKDYAEAVRWYRKSADASNGRGMFNLGLAHARGRGGLSKDDAEAVRWFRKSADAGDGRGMCRIGTAYLYGEGGLTKDDAGAVRWFRKSADAGDGLGMCNLGVAYCNGQGGLSKDDAEAVRWFRKSADEGDGEGMCNLGTAYKDGQGGLTKDEAEAVLWYRKSAEVGSGRGMCNLGVANQKGMGGLTKDDSEAVRWYRKAADVGDGLGMCNMGVAYERGLGGLSKDDAEAVRWYRSSADTGLSRGMCYLGMAYENGQGGLTKDSREAIRWYRRALVSAQNVDVETINSATKGLDRLGAGRG